MMVGVPGPVDFFVSYTSADRPWAEWIAWELKQAGHSVIVQAWDMQPGSNFVLAMDNATRAAERTIAVLSPAFLQSPYGRAEWAAAFREDPDGERRKLIPVRVRACQPDGLLGSVVYVDVVELGEVAAREALLASVSAERAKPAGAPGFPAAPTREQVKRPQRGAAIFNVPVMTRTFIGRERALEQLAEGLSGGGAVAVTQVDAIHGLGGVGKTQLAARYARTRRDAYDVIWWLRCEQPATLREDLAALAVALGLLDVDVEEPDAIQAARGWLERNPRWLLVLDNAPAPAAIADVLPEGEGGHVLITSRVHADWRSLGARPIALDVWEREESVAFLRARTGEHEDRVLDALAHALGDLPLALEQAAAYINAKGITAAGYLERLRDRPPELFAAGRPAGYGHTVATVWSLAFEELAQHPVAWVLVRVCAHMAPEPIPRELLDAYSTIDEDASVTAAMVDDAVELMLNYAVVTASARATLTMHRLIGQLARVHATPEERQDAVATAVALIGAVTPRHAWEPEHWAECERVLGHVDVVIEHATTLDAADEQCFVVLHNVALHQRARGRYESARHLVERALAVADATGVALTARAAMLMLLGSVQRRLGELINARATLERAVSTLEASPEHTQRDISIALGELGSVVGQAGDVAEACRILDRALAIAMGVMDAQDPDLAIIIGHQGAALRRLGDLPAARSACERALAIQDAYYPDGHPEVAITLGNLSSVCARLGDLETARDLQQRALTIFESFHGLEHPAVAPALGNLAGVLAQLGDLRAARATLERALAIEEAAYAPNREHPEIGITLGHLGALLQRLGDPDGARAACERALAIEEAVYGHEHWEVARALANLGSVLADQRDFIAARKVLRRALSVYQAADEVRHVEVAATLTHLADVQRELGALGAARRHLRSALVIQQSELGPDHPDTLHTRRYLESLAPT